MPSAWPRMGEMKHSSVGMLGLKLTPLSVVSQPPQNRAWGIIPTVRLVPLEARYSRRSIPRLLR